MKVDDDGVASGKPLDAGAELGDVAAGLVTEGKRSGRRENGMCLTCRSDWHRPASPTFTSTSPRPISGTGTSRISWVLLCCDL